MVTDLPAGAPEPARKGGVSWKVLLTVALVMALGGTAGGVVLMSKLDKGDDKPNSAQGDPANAQPAAPPATTPAATTPAAAASTPSATPSATSVPVSAAPGKPTASGGVTAPARPTGYQPVIEKKPLSIPAAEYSSEAYRIDLTAGTVVPRGSDLKWGLGLSRESTSSGSRADSFESVGDNKSDFAVITEAAITPEQCAIAIDSRPDTDLTFNRVTPGRLLCIRDRVTRNIAIAAVDVADPTTGAAKVTLNTYRAS
ncbi:hypothetical protein GCM10009639_16730 [Kitasatospora putterlickiae]|uniref:Uncharacterized protein n=1 Tax=Kitasatospora putterlickiae TaxID=221725 RepID=A0ABN1XVA9_9ACTN